MSLSLPFKTMSIQKWHGAQTNIPYPTITINQIIASKVILIVAIILQKIADDFAVNACAICFHVLCKCI